MGSSLNCGPFWVLGLGFRVEGSLNYGPFSLGGVGGGGGGGTLT